MKELSLKQLAAALTVPRLLNLLAVWASLLLSKTIRRPLHWGMPYVLTVEPTNVCNLACPQCDTGAGLLRRAKGFLDPALYEKILLTHHRSLLYLLLYDQGEPLLHRDYAGLVQLAKAHRVCVTCSTNGILLADSSLADRLVASGLDNVIVSLDGLTPESYRAYRKGGELDLVRQGIRHLVDARRAQASRTPRILLQFLVMKHNEHERAGLIDNARAWGADQVLFKSVQVRNEEDAQLFLPQDEKYRRYRLSANGLTVKGAPVAFCERLWYSSVIHWDGAVVPCCFDKDNHHRLGSLRETNWPAIWRGEKRKAFITQVHSANKPPICKNCTHGLRIYS